MTKVCSKCNLELHVSDFGARRRSSDGLQGHCRKCQKKYKDEYREKNGDRVTFQERIYNAEYKKKNKDKIRAYNRVYFARYRKENRDKLLAYNRPRNAEYWEKNKDSDEFRERRATYASEYKKRNPEKKRAHDMVNKRIAIGKMQRQPCEKCGTDIKVHAHHDDYSKPLEVRWLCHMDHIAHHQAMRTGEGIENHR